MENKYLNLMARMAVRMILLIVVFSASLLRGINFYIHRVRTNSDFQMNSVYGIIGVVFIFSIIMIAVMWKVISPLIREQKILQRERLNEIIQEEVDKKIKR